MKTVRNAVKRNGAIGEWFTVLTGMRLGCILSPLSGPKSHGSGKKHRNE